jgi:DNA-binding FadR family transcriptional regulator
MHERAAVVLVTDIVAGRLQPGEAFPSSEELVVRFGFSRTVARETLQALSALGLVSVQQGKRTEICGPGLWQILSPVIQEALWRENLLEPVWRDLYEFRLMVEPRAAAWMAARGSAEAVAQLTALAAEISVLAEDVGNVRNILLADRSFHTLIGRSSSNCILGAVNQTFWDAVAVLWLESETRLAQEELTLVAEQHERIADGITRRDAVAAAAAMEDHLMAASTMDVGQFRPIS